tara:strand:+ start:905 stop:1090 length:186 start_codon:yes stop_codon:yes gene_type:complete
MLKILANVAQKGTVMGLVGLTGFGVYTIANQVSFLRAQAAEYARLNPDDNVLDISKMKPKA